METTIRKYYQFYEFGAMSKVLDLLNLCEEIKNIPFSTKAISSDSKGIHFYISRSDDLEFTQNCIDKIIRVMGYKVSVTYDWDANIWGDVFARMAGITTPPAGNESESAT